MGELLSTNWGVLADFATVGALIVAVISYIHANYRDKSIRRAELVKSYTSDFYASEEIVDLFMDIDYERFRFNNGGEWLGGKDEASMVRMLDLFNSVGHNHRRRVLTLSDIHGTTLGYAILRAYESGEVRSYLEHVKAWDGDHLGTGVPFEHFQNLGNALSRRSAAARERNLGRAAVVDPGAPRETTAVPPTELDVAPSVSKDRQADSPDE